MTFGDMRRPRLRFTPEGRAWHQAHREHPGYNEIGEECASCIADVLARSMAEEARRMSQFLGPSEFVADVLAAIDRDHVHQSRKPDADPR
jgi:hypothetical protein